jgi:hypothetical protein
MSREKAAAAALGQHEPSLGSGGHGRSLVVRAPGGRLRRLAQLCCSKTAYTTAFAPILDEMCTDHCAALAAGDLVGARFALVRGRSLFWLAVVELLVSWIKKLIF